MDTLDESEARASMICNIGGYAERIDNLDDLLESFLDNCLMKTAMVKLSWRDRLSPRSWCRRFSPWPLRTVRTHHSWASFLNVDISGAAVTGRSCLLEDLLNQLLLLHTTDFFVTSLAWEEQLMLGVFQPSRSGSAEKGKGLEISGTWSLRSNIIHPCKPCRDLVSSWLRTVLVWSPPSPSPPPGECWT